MRYALWGNFGSGNFGNEATLFAAIYGLRQVDPDVALTVVCSQPTDVGRRHGVEAIAIGPERGMGLPEEGKSTGRGLRWAREVFDWFRVWRELGRIDELLIAGTGMLYEVGAGMLGAPYQLWKWVVLARWRRKIVRFVSVGADGLDSARTPGASWRSRVRIRWCRWCYRYSLGNAAYRSFRDTLSRERAGSLIASALNDPLYPDLAFGLPRFLQDQQPRPAEETRRSVVLGLYAIEADTSAFTQYIELIGEVVRQLIARGDVPRVIVGDASYDRSAVVALRAWLDQNAVSGVVFEDPRCFEDVIKILATARFAIASRFHNVLLSLWCGTPVLSLSHMPKNDQLMLAVGMSEYSLAISNAAPSEIAAKICDLDRNETALRTRIGSAGELFRSEISNQYKAIMATKASSRF